MIMTLDQLPTGRNAAVMAVNSDEPLKRKLYDFGLVAGTQIQCRYRSPKGDVTAIALRGSVLALRTEDLRRIIVRPD